MQPAERRQPRPQTHIGGRRVLALDPPDAFEAASNRQSGTFQEELAREERTIQLSLGQDALGDRRSLRPIVPVWIRPGAL